MVYPDGESAEFAIRPGRRAYVHIARGAVTVNGELLEAGDALKLTGATALQLRDGRGAEVLVFDLP